MRTWASWLPPLAGVAILVGMAIGGVRAWRHRFDWLGPRVETISQGEAVDDIRKLNRLVVFRAYLTSTTTTHETGWFSESDQTMLTPAYVNYYVDMSAMTPRSIEVRGQQVFVALPPLMIERPNIDVAHVQTFNAGLWSHLAGTAERLRVANSKQATVQLFARAKMPFLADAARKAAVEAVTANVQVTLTAGGHPGLTVRVIG